MKYSLSENSLPNFVGPSPTVSDYDVSQSGKFGNVRSYAENLKIAINAFGNFHPLIVHPIKVHGMM